MSKVYGGQNMVNPLQSVLVRRPEASFGQAKPQQWHYTDQPNLTVAQQEHEAFVHLLEQADVAVNYHETHLPHHADAIFVRDPILMTDEGAIILQMGKPLRQGEEEAIAATLQQMQIPICYQLHGEAHAEGGDLLWLDEKTLVAGLGFRTNRAALTQLRQAIPSDVAIIHFDLPYNTGPEACLHLTSFISLVDHDLAVVYPPLIPVGLWQTLKQRNFQIIEVPSQEWATMGSNVLALGPRQCLMLDQNPITQHRLEAVGCQVLTYKGNEISLKAEGGPTCLTQAICRQPSNNIESHS